MKIIEVILSFIKKFKSFFGYLFGYFVGMKMERLKTKTTSLEDEVKRKEDLYEALRRIDAEKFKRIADYHKLRKERGDKQEYIINL